jgi:serine/threonine protein phosphatase PrpC
MTLPSRTGGNGSVVLDERGPGRSGTLRFAGASHPGLVRERNEDRLYIDTARGLLVVVDGMGGAAAGEVAAETALDRLLERLERRTGTPEDRVREAIVSANNEIERLARENPAWEGMGCVLTLALIEKGVVTVGHVGDSRLYRLHAGRLDKLTHDHSPIGMREDHGELSERDAMRHPRRNEVYRSLGSEPRGPRDADFIEVLRFPLEREDAILICSDGLTDLVPSSEIARVVGEHAGDERALVQRLVDAANAAGGKDNVTVAFAAGERFAADFTRDRRVRGRAGAARGSGGEAVAIGRGFWGRRSTSFALGALAGLAVYGGLQLLDGRTRREARTTPDPQLIPIASRHEVGAGHSFRTIGDALAAARSGDTVAVHPGRYREQVRLEEGVTLMAVVPGRAVIEPLPPADGTAPVAALVAEGIGAGRVSGLVIAGSPGAPIDYGVVIRRAAVTVENVEVRGAKVAGVSIEDAGGAALLASYVHDNLGAGIAVRGAGRPLVLQNRVLDNGRGNPPAPGIDVESKATPRIVGNVIAGNGAEGVRGLPARSPLLEANVFEASGKVNRAVGPERARVGGRR